jgi:eukaryotic-like serine/threonine-protein kinase
MHRPWPPWWMMLLGAMFLFCAGVIYYDIFFGPDMGWMLMPAQNLPASDYRRVALVVPGSGSDQAGFQVGDLVARQDFLTFAETARMGARYEWEVQRGDQRQVISFTLRPRNLDFWLQREGIRCLLLLAVSTLYFALAAAIVLARPRDIVARWGALFLGQFGIFVIWMVYPLGNGTPEHWVVIRGLPIPLGIAVLIPLSFANRFPAGAWTLLYSFPHRPFQRGWTWTLVWVPSLMVIQLDLRNCWLAAYSPKLADAMPRSWLLPAYGLGVVFAFVAVVLLMRNYLRLKEINERRRLRFMVVGLAGAVLAGALFMIQTMPLPQLERLRTGLFQLSVSSSVLAILLSFPPVCTAYAILRHRMFDIRVMVRLGLQYAAARGLLLSLVPIVAIVLGIDLLQHRNQPLVDILSGRGWIYAVLGLGAFLLHTRQKPWLEALDRRFYRERYNAQRILRSIMEDIRAAASFEQEASRVVSQIETALHPEFVAILARKPGGDAYRVLAARPAPPPEIPAGSRLISLVRLLGKPVEIEQTETGWLRRQLPPEESDFVASARLEWIFPISLAADQTEALVALGPKLSEEPYSHEDQDLLEGITASLALLLQRLPAQAAVPESFEECPECGACYDSGTRLCTREGVKLATLPFARLLDARYQFERRLGRGGMGTVYEAFDKELERHVAVKLIRADLTAHPEAAVRFKREAKAAAGFTHPNVVTVYDYGVAEGERPYLVMELLRGCTLRQELLRQQRIIPARAVEVLRGVCAAVEAAHERQLLHRDLKPENIFLAQAGIQEVAKVLDFGLVKAIAPSEDEQTATLGDTGPGVLVGTLRYMSPEQLRGEVPSGSWDLWALAVVAYEMLTGAYPFAVETAASLHQAVLSARATPVQAHVSEAPVRWSAFFERSLAADRRLRPASASQFFTEFQQILHR